MKTEYRPIAMRCTQEQFDSIKDRIPLPIVDVESFDKYPLLINFYCEQKVVSNSLFFDNVETHEKFDGELFLYCCGGGEKIDRPYQDLFNYMSEEHGFDLLESDIQEIERLVLKDKVWAGSELQFKREGCDEWFDGVYWRTYRLKPQPNYTAEIEALEKKAKENGQKVIIKFE